MSIRRALLVVLSCLAVASCSSSEGNGAGPSTEEAGSAGDAGAVSQTVGTGGGTVAAPGVNLTFAQGSLASSTIITVNAGGAAPQGYVALSPLFDFGPEGTTFPQAVTVSFAISGGMNPAVFWSNAQGGYDELATTATGSTASAQVTHFSHGFCGESKKKGMDASVSSSGSSSGGSGNSSGASSGSSGGAGSSGGSSSGSSSGSASSSSGAASSGSSSGSGGSSSGGSSSSSGGSTSSSSSGGSSSSSGGSTSSSSSGGSSSSSGGSSSSSSGGITDSGGSGGDASATPGIVVMIDGNPTTFANNISVSLLQAWWQISADDAPSGPHWTVSLVTPASAGQQLSCSGGLFPSMSYRHFASSDAGADMTFTSENEPGSSCTIFEIASGMDAGAPVQGTFSGVLRSGPADAGGASHMFSGGSYDVAAP